MKKTIEMLEGVLDAAGNYEAAMETLKARNAQMAELTAERDLLRKALELQAEAGGCCGRGPSELPRRDYPYVPAMLSLEHAEAWVEAGMQHVAVSPEALVKLFELISSAARVPTTAAEGAVLHQPARVVGVEYVNALAEVQAKHNIGLASIQDVLKAEAESGHFATIQWGSTTIRPRVTPDAFDKLSELMSSRLFLTLHQSP